MVMLFLNCDIGVLGVRGNQPNQQLRDKDEDKPFIVAQLDQSWDTNRKKKPLLTLTNTLPIHTYKKKLNENE